MSTPSLLSFAAIWFVLGMSPGPNAAFCVANGMTAPRRVALMAPVGIAAASILHVGLAALGAGTLFVRSPPAFQLLKWVGVAYMVWLGVRQLRSTGELPTSTDTYMDRATMARRGVTVSMTNPKALLQYAAVLPQFVRPEGSPAAQFAILGAVSVPIVWANYTIYVMAASSLSKWLTIDRTRRVRRGVGVIYLLAAGMLSTSTR